MQLRECDCAEKPGAPSCEGCTKRQLQRSDGGLRPSRIPASGRVHPRVTSAIDASRGGGRPLEAAARARLEHGLGESLGDVRVHADAHAAALARAVSARAFAVGPDLFFAAGAYRPGSCDGDKLIAHEVIHAVQQRGAPTSGPLSVSAPGDATEVEAEVMASTMQAEASAHPNGGPFSVVGHEPARTAGARQATCGAAIAIARTLDFSDPYRTGYNDGQAGNPQAPPSPFSSDAIDAYNEGYQNGQAQAGAGPTASGGGSLLGAGTFTNSGPSTLGPLGYFTELGFYMNGVQLTFPAGAAAGAYTNLTPRQWQGPEATYTCDQYLGGPWNTLLNDSGKGSDEILAKFQSVTASAVTYYDEPGPLAALYLADDPALKRVHTVQNFTGWVEGVPMGGGPAQRISDILAWHSVMSLGLGSDDAGKPSFQPYPPTGSGTGWVGTGPPSL
jgi:hypothetical protein